MREILFRGKRMDNGEWIEGFLVKDTSFYGKPDNHAYIINHEHPSGCFGSDIYIEVDPDTVGQFVGQTDKNGKKIFDGDILYGILDSEIECWLTVEWRDFGWYTHEPGFPPDEMIEYNGARWSVIGNIHDNPGLKEKEEHAG